MGIEKGNLSWRKNKNLVILDFVDNIVQKFEPSKSNFPFPFLSLSRHFTIYVPFIYVKIMEIRVKWNPSIMSLSLCKYGERNIIKKCDK